MGIARKTFVIGLAIGIMAVAMVGVAYAAKGGKAGTTGGGSATLSASPNPALAGGSVYHMTGCGYVQGKQVNLVIDEPAMTAFFPAGVDTKGCIDAAFWTDGPGTYGIRAMQNLSGRKQTTLASTTLDVVSG